MKKTNLFLGAICISFMSGTGLALAQPAPEATPKAKPTEVSSLPESHLTRKQISEKLQLTKEQKQEIRKNRAAYRKTNAELDGQLKVKKVELENEMEKPEPDEAKLKQTADEIGDLQGMKVSAKIKAELVLEKKILTPQQVEMLKTLQGKENPASDEIL